MDNSFLLLGMASLSLILAHVMPSIPTVRLRIVTATGEPVFMITYSLAALVIISWMVTSFTNTPLHFLWVPGPVLRHVPLVVMPFSLILLVVGVSTRNPTGMRMAKAVHAKNPAPGVLRITRHPVQWAIILWAAAHILANGDLASLLFFGGFLGLSAIGSVMLDRKRHADLGQDWQRFAAITSHVPFVAIVKRKNQLNFAEIGWTRILIALVAFVVILATHHYLFGIVPY